MAVWVTTDLHGNYNLWEQIKAFLQEDDTLIFLGDAIDRGSRGFEIFMEMLEDPRVVYLKGNHEDMMYESFHEIGPDRGKMLKHWTKGGNGGQETLDNIKSLNLDYDTKMEYINTIARLPYYAEYENADNIFPEKLLWEIRQFVPEGYIYVPSRHGRKEWGTLSGQKKMLEKRNLEIYEEYQSGKSVDEISSEKYLSKSSIYRILKQFDT